MSSDQPKMKLSFKFSKVADTKSKIVKLNGSHQEVEKESKSSSSIDYITTIDNNQIIGTKPQINGDKKHCVIPLIKINKYKIPDDKKDQPVTANNSIPLSGDTNDLDAKAKQELLREANNLDGEEVPAWKALIINKAPNAFENDDKLDVSIRPAEPTLDDYSAVPIEGFGLGMLRGMGWKDGEAIGGKNKSITPIFEPKLRAKGLGLGADAVKTREDADRRRKAASEKPDEIHDKKESIKDNKITIKRIRP